MHPKMSLGHCSEKIINMRTYSVLLAVASLACLAASAPSSVIHWAAESGVPYVTRDVVVKEGAVLTNDCDTKEVIGATVVRKPVIQKTLVVRPPQISTIVRNVASFVSSLHTEPKSVGVTKLVTSMLPSTTVYRKEFARPTVYYHEPEVVAPTLYHKRVVPHMYVNEPMLSSVVHKEHFVSMYDAPEVYTSPFVHTEHKLVQPSVYFSDPEHYIERFGGISDSKPDIEISPEISSSVASNPTDHSVSIVGPTMNVIQQSSSRAY